VRSWKCGQETPAFRRGMNGRLLSVAGCLCEKRERSRGVSASGVRYAWRQVVDRQRPTGERKADGGWWTRSDADGPMGEQARCSTQQSTGLRMRTR
jgi:hypothetical protein